MSRPHVSCGTRTALLIWWASLDEAYSIQGWDEHFENAASRKLRHLTWVPIPNRHDTGGYRRVMRHERGPEIYAAWVLMVQVASKSNPRGSLSNGSRPFDAEDLADKTGCPAEVFRIAFEVLSSERIGWLRKSATIAAESPTTAAGSGARDCLKGTEGNRKRTEPKTLPAAQAKREPKPHKPNPLWDALAAVFYPTGVPPGDTRMLGRIVADLKAMGAEPGEVTRRCERYLATFSTPLTVHALKKNWNVLSEVECAKRLNANSKPDDNPARVRRDVSRFAAFSGSARSNGSPVQPPVADSPKQPEPVNASRPIADGSQGLLGVT